MPHLIERAMRFTWTCRAYALVYTGLSVFFLVAGSAAENTTLARTPYPAMILGPPTLLTYGTTALPAWVAATIIIAALVVVAIRNRKWRTLALTTATMSWIGSGCLAWVAGT